MFYPCRPLCPNRCTYDSPARLPFQGGGWVWGQCFRGCYPRLRWRRPFGLRVYADGRPNSDNHHDTTTSKKRKGVPNAKGVHHTSPWQAPGFWSLDILARRAFSIVAEGTNPQNRYPRRLFRPAMARQDVLTFLSCQPRCRIRCDHDSPAGLPFQGGGWVWGQCFRGCYPRLRWCRPFGLRVYRTGRPQHI